MGKIYVPSQSDFTEEELDIIDEITITLALLFSNIIENMNSKNILQQSSKMSSSLSYLTTVAYTMKLIFLYHEQGQFTGEIKEEIAKMLCEKQQQDLLNNESLMSKVLKNFENNGVIFRVRGDQDIKAQSSTNISKKPKDRRPRRIGVHNISKFTRTVEDYKLALSNPKALEFINYRLVKYGLLSETYSTIFKESFQAFKKGDESFFKNLEMFKVLFQGVDFDLMPDSKTFQALIKSLSDTEMESLRQQFLTYYIKNPNYPIFFIFSLYKFRNQS